MPASQFAAIALFWLLWIFSSKIYVQLYVVQIILNKQQYQDCVKYSQRLSKEQQLGVYKIYDDTGSGEYTDVILYDELGEINQAEQSVEWSQAMKRTGLLERGGYSVDPLIDNFYLVRFFYYGDWDSRLHQKYNRNYYPLNRRLSGNSM